MLAGALTLLLAVIVTRNYFHLGAQQTSTILGHKVVAPQYQLMSVGGAALLEAGRDMNVYRRRLHQKGLHLK